MKKSKFGLLIGGTLMIKDAERLEERIQQLKKELILKVEETGFDSPATLNCSQQLDKLITIYQRNARNSEFKKLL